LLAAEAVRHGCLRHIFVKPACIESLTVLFLSPQSRWEIDELVYGLLTRPSCAAEVALQQFPAFVARSKMTASACGLRSPLKLVSVSVDSKVHARPLRNDVISGMIAG
jgi:hypothetical protein